MPHHARTSGHRGYTQRHTFRIANCNIRETGLEAIQGALKIQQRHTQKWLLPQLSISQSEHPCVARQCQTRWEGWRRGAQPCCRFSPKRAFQQESGAIATNDVAKRFMREVDQFPHWPSHCLWGGQAFQHLRHLQIWSSPQGYKN